jgi:hypothetical protein
MRYWIQLLTTLTLMIFATHSVAVCPGDLYPWLRNYDGTIGDEFRARMTLVITGDKVEGVYFYATQLKDISLRGKIIDGSKIILDELDSEGNVTAQFDGEFPEQDPHNRYKLKLQCEVIAGSWHKIGSEKKLPFYFSNESDTGSTLSNRYSPAGVTDDELIHRNAKRFWDAVKNKDKKTVASLVKYPIRVGISNGTKRIKGPDELIANYDAIFSPAYVKAISNALPRNMFCRYNGIMLGRRGEVWFNAHGKVIALNNY